MFLLLCFRYEASVCSRRKMENLEGGVLELLLPHLPTLNELCSKGLNATFKLSPPKNLNGEAWFTKSTLNRFLLPQCSWDLTFIELIIVFFFSWVGGDRIAAYLGLLFPGNVLFNLPDSLKLRACPMWQKPPARLKMRCLSWGKLESFSYLWTGRWYDLPLFQKTFYIFIKDYMVS